MYTIERYIAGIKALTNSLVIKINEIPMVINAGVENTIGYDPLQDKPTKGNIREWKYYLNLAGKMHRLDKPITIRVLETEQDEILTADLLNTYPTTKAELLKMDKFYKNYTDEHPEYIRYIHGCMFPVDIDRAIEAPEGTILAYNKDFVEDNEYYLIPELQRYIKDMLIRWHVKPYTIVDSLYLPSLIAFLYSSIYLKIINLRLDKISTFQVHSFHLEHFFRSRLDLWDEVNILNKKSLFWLYKNLDVMMHNVGKDLTFKKVYDKLFQMNGIGIGEYTLNRIDPKFSDGKNDVYQPSYIRDPANLITKQLNSSYLTNNGNTESIESMTTRQLTILEDVNKNMPATFQDYIKKVVKEDTNRNILAEQKTKVIDIDRAELLKKTGLDLFSLVLDYWVYGLHKDKLYKMKVQYNGNISSNKKKNTLENNDVNYVDNENKIYNVSPKVGLLMFLKLMLYASGDLNAKLTSITYNRVCDFDPVRFQNTIDIIINDGVSRPVLEAIKTVLPVEPDVFSTIEMFKKFLNESIELAKIVWVLCSNVQNFFTSDAIKRVFLTLIKRDKYYLSDDNGSYTIDELLKQHGVTFPISPYTDIVATMKSMIKTFTGVELDQEDILLQNMDKYRRIIKKLTSYSLHAMGSAGVIDDITVYYNNPTVLTTKNGFVITYGLLLKGLEDDIARLKANSWESPGGLYVNIIELRPQLALAKLRPIIGDMVLKFSELRKDGWTFGYSADFETIPSFRLDDYKWYNDWLTIKQVELSALEKTISDMDATAIDSTQAPDSNSINLKGALLEYQKLYGELIVKNGPWLEEVGAYNFNTIPTFWDTFASSQDYLKTIGISLVPVEDVDYTLAGSSSEPNDDIASKTVLKGDMKLLEEVSGYGVEKHVLKTEATYDFTKTYTTLDISDFVSDSKYVKVGLMAFTYDKQDGTPTAIEEVKNLFTYVVEDVVKQKPEILSRINNTVGVQDNAEVFNKLKKTTLDKADAVGLAMLPYKVVSNGETYDKCKLLYIGLIDKDGNMDVYDCSKVKVLTYDDLKLCPMIKTVPNAYNGKLVSLPSKVSKDKVITVSVNLVDNLTLPALFSNPKDNNQKLVDMFTEINGFQIGRTVRAKYDPAVKESILPYFVPGLDTNRTLYHTYPMSTDFTVYVSSELNTLPKDLPYTNKGTLRDHLSKILAYDESLGYTAQYKWIMINSVYYKLTDVITFTAEEYPRIGNNKDNVYVLPNKPMLYIDIIESLKPDETNKLLIIEYDRGWKPRCCNFKTFTRNYTFEEFKEEIGSNTVTGNIPHYIVNPKINTMLLGKDITDIEFKNRVLSHAGYYEIGRLEFVNVGNNLVTGISTTPTKEDLLTRFGNEYPWLKNLNIEE